MKIEILLATLKNLSNGASAILLLWLLAQGGSMMAGSLSFDEDFAKSCFGMRKRLTRFWPLMIFFSLLMLVPSLDEIWKVRIALIKLELASPENVLKGTEEIGRIAKKLECKYLGCTEEKK